ncbi:MAG: gst [Myxococcaceae bacterium]|nr:gst [Myxococcaceae bacterium]
MIKVSAFRWVPPFAQGLVRDVRVRWALEEAGLPYEVRLLGLGDNKSEAYRHLQPFGQVPSYEEDGLEMFESGAIVMHIAERSEALMPADPEGRALTKTWMFAALNSIEPWVAMLGEVDLFAKEQEWAKLRRPSLVEFLKERLGALSKRLGDREYLEARFTAGDLLMATVLRNLRQSDVLSDFPTLAAYRTRCEARPAFQKALAAQMKTFAENAPPNAPSPAP